MQIREKIAAYVEKQDPVYRRIALDIHEHPEVSNYEFFACERLSNQLKEEGFRVTVNVAGHRTGFIGTYTAQKPRPVLVFLAEYDALAGLGHGCGHNLFGATSLLAAAALKQVIDVTGGEVRVYGTPARKAAKTEVPRAASFGKGFLRMLTPPCAFIRATGTRRPAKISPACPWTSNFGESLPMRLRPRSRVSTPWTR